MKAKSLLSRLTAACMALGVLFSGVASADSVTVTTGKLNLRKEANASSKSLAIVREGEELSFVAEADDWYQVKSGSQIGFVTKEYVSLDRSELAADVEKNTEMFSSALTGRTSDRVNMRELPITTSDIEKVVPKNGTVEVIGQCGIWYLVKYSGRTGYLMAQYVTVEGKAETAPSQPDSSDNNSSNNSSADENYAAARSGKTTTRVNMRKGPSTNAEVEKVLGKNDSVILLGENGTWYKVNAGGKVGYVSKAYITLTSDSSPSVPSVPPVSPSVPDTEIYDNTVSGAATERVNLRAAASTSSSVLKVLAANQSLTIEGETGSWYKVKVDGKSGYVAKAYVRITTNNSGSNDSGSDDSTVVPDGLISYPAARSGVTTTKVNLREAANTSCKVVKLLDKSTALSVLGEMNGFYQVKAGSYVGFVSKDYVILGVSGSTEEDDEDKDDSYNDSSDDSDNAPSADETIYSSTRTGTTTVKVNMRREPEGTVLFVLPANTYITLIGERGSWYKVTYNASTGYISKAYVTDSVISAPVQPEQPGKDETAAPEKPDESKAKTAYVSAGTVNMRKGPGTSYGVIKVLKKGDEITCYQLTGDWYSIKAGSDTGYISAKYVTTTKPEASAPAAPDNGTTDTKPASGKVQMADWWTSGIQKTFARGVIATVTDVDTGLSWQVKRSGGTNHADVQPLTAADTAKMKQAYGGKWKWDRRAIWVTIDGVRYAASMNGMPHGTGSITTNNFDGHHCIHFLNSRTHEGNRLDPAHQSMVQKAYKAGQ